MPNSRAMSAAGRPSTAGRQNACPAPSANSAWLGGILKDKLRDYYRQHAREPPGAGGSDAQQQLLQVPEKPPESSSEAGAPGADVALVHRALALIQVEFEERTWQAFWRSAVDGHAAADIARELGMTPRAVRQAKYRVLKRLRAELG